MVSLEIWGCLGQVCSGFGGPEVSSVCFIVSSHGHSCRRIWGSGIVVWGLVLGRCALGLGALKWAWFALSFSVPCRPVSQRI